MGAHSLLFDYMKTVDELARSFSCSVATVRRWLWHLSIKPERIEERWFQTARGRRLAKVNLYGSQAEKKLNQDMQRGG